jgi:probable F420-dependent oxidoreductase
MMTEGSKQGAVGMDKRRFRFGVQISQAASRAEWVEKAKKAEALGFDVLVMPDHLGGDFAVGPALAVVAEATAALRLGTLVLQNDLRHPALVALEAATLDVLTDGRFELGLGAGGAFMPDYERTGIPFEPPRIRVGRLEESLRVVKGLFGESAVTFAGRHYSITDLEGFPKPVQRPRPPLLGGGGGPRLLSIAAREADIVSIFPTMLPTGGQFRDEETRTAAVAAKVDLIRDAAGDRFSDLELNILVQVVVAADSRQAGIDQLSARWGVSAEDAVDSPYIFVGTPDEMADQP